MLIYPSKLVFTACRVPTQNSGEPLNQNAIDYAVSAAKAALGMVPFAGSLLAELAGTIVPKQRLDRLVDFSKRLERTIGGLEQVSVRQKLADENFTDLFEETARQAAQAVAEERREYLATLLAAGLSESQVSFVESRHLLRLLGQINDIEIVWLRAYLHPYFGGDDEFRAKHAAILEPVAATLSSDQTTHDRRALQENYAEHLVSLGLLRRRLRIDTRTNNPIFNRLSQTWEIESTEVTPLGRLLLRFIGLSLPHDDA